MDDDRSNPARPAWWRWTLVAAGVYNLAWAALVISLPNLLFEFAGAEPPNYPAIWQCLGMVIGVYGVGYLLASRDPVKHWVIVAVGLLGKLLGPPGFVLAALRGELPWAWGITIVTNDLIWWIPFIGILYGAFKSQCNTEQAVELSFDDAVRTLESQRGTTIAQLSRDAPLMLVFLRHLGCGFCREAMGDIAMRREWIESQGTRIGELVHMGPEPLAAETAAQYGLNDLDRFCDPSCGIYRAFGLKRAQWWQVFGPKVVWRAIEAMLHGYRATGIIGDDFRMPGIFLLHDGRIVAEYRHRTAADRPDYVELTQTALSQTGRRQPGLAV